MRDYDVPGLCEEPAAKKSPRRGVLRARVSPARRLMLISSGLEKHRHFMRAPRSFLWTSPMEALRAILAAERSLLLLVRGSRKERVERKMGATDAGDGSIRDVRPMSLALD